MQASAENTDNLLRRDFIAAMRQVANSVAVVTTAGSAGKHGATVSSFCSVSADPAAMLVCLHDKSSIAAQVCKNGCFCLNVLPQEMEKTADKFAGRFDEDCADRFEGVGHEDRAECGPYISGALAFHCRPQTVHVSGSHRVIVALVTHIEGGVSRPLTYLDGQYRPWLI